MRVILHSTMAGPNGVFHAGQTVELPDDEANWLLKQGSAERAETPVEAPPADVDLVETAALQPPETRRRKGRR